MSVHEDRRDAKSLRIPFEAIVEIGGDVDQGRAFEAQGVDLSANGMHLRTAYLPELGQPLLCRFGSGAQEISAEADVVWRREEPRGGEFGIRFTNLDGASMATLWDLCGVSPNEPELPIASTSSAKIDVDTGTRVRLHIDGLGSPMKARVRGVQDGELLVGSNLEFLRVGRSLELEDVDRGGKRPAHIDRVDVDIDRASRVPQLVVTLRYDDVSSEEPVSLTKVTRSARPDEVKSARLSDSSENEASEPIAAPTTTTVAATASVPASDDMADELEAARLLRGPVSAAATRIMPHVTAFGLRAKTTLALLAAKAMKGAGSARAEREAPRRTTSPPPTGALHTSGKRVVRETEAEQESPDAPRPKLGKKTIVVALGASGALLAVIVASMVHKGSPPPGAAQSELTAAPSTAPSVAAQAETQLSASGALQANVPLFGPTPLSTTEPVSPAPLGGIAVPPGSPAAFAASQPSGSIEEVDDKSESDRDGSSSKHPKVASFGHGKVSHPTVLRLKTDGEISAMQGARMPTGFTVTIPGRRMLETGSALAARDGRIASVKVQNSSKGSVLTFQFKDGTPSYVVRVKGHDLQVALGHAQADDADDKSDASKHRTASSKHADGEGHHRSKKD